MHYLRPNMQILDKVQRSSGIDFALALPFPFAAADFEACFAVGGRASFGCTFAGTFTCSRAATCHVWRGEPKV
jgi:hypothetical protein